jgi:anaerobic magnesium-protoporphyrin IX monomethyl ester cyclase
LLNRNINSIKGIAFKRGKKVIFTGKRELIEDLNEISFPSRELFENLKYQDYCQKLFGYKSTLVMTTRGCPFSCNFCSKPVFGDVYRARSPENVIEEIREIINLGYNRLWFADDIFTLNKNRTMAICKKILQERINIEWDCLCRIDCSDLELLSWMKKAGCQRVFFGIESGSDRMLKLMGKEIKAEEARLAVKLAKKVGLETAGFFMLGYPGETTESLLKTIKFSTSLPLDYLSYSIAYPIPGTAFFEQIKGSLLKGEWDFEGQNKLKFQSAIPERKLKLAIFKGNVKFKLRRRFKKLSLIFVLPFEYITDIILRIMK